MILEHALDHIDLSLVCIHELEIQSQETTKTNTKTVAMMEQ